MKEYLIVTLLFCFSFYLKSFAQLSFTNLSYDFGTEFKVFNQINNFIYINEIKNDCLKFDYVIIYKNDTLKISENTFTLNRKENKNTSDTLYFHKSSGEIIKVSFLGLNIGDPTFAIEKQLKEEIQKKDLLQNNEFKIYFRDSIEGIDFFFIDFEAFVINQKGDTILLPWSKKNSEINLEENENIQKNKFSKHQIRILRKAKTGSELYFKNVTFLCPYCCFKKKKEFNLNYKII